METKSRYEVISDLESKKRELIKERDGLSDEVLKHKNELKNMQRQKADNIMVLDRHIEDKTLFIENFELNLKERKQTINELIKSIDDSLKRFESMKQQS